MNNFFKHVDNKYFTSIGEGKLSPLNQATVGLCMTYIDCFKKDDFEKKPLVIGIPNKQWATLWIASGLMTNLFYREATNQNEDRLNKLNLKKGDRIELFGKPTKWQGFNSNGKGQILVTQSAKNAYGRNEKNTITYPLPDIWIPFINRDFSNRKSIISITLLQKKLKEKRTKETALEKILNHKKAKSLGISSKSLKDKVLIVSGRGDKGRFIREIKETIIHDENLSDIFLLDHNLFVEVDLENYKNIADHEFKENKDYFKIIALKRLKNLKSKFRFADKKIDDLLNLIEGDKYLTENFISKLESLIDLVDEENEELLEYILDEHPGVVSNTLDNLKAIVINDISLLSDYERTINLLCKKGIPVIILSDFYSDFDSEQIETEEYYRFFWGTQKINYLLELEEDESPLDDKVWNLSKRFSNQFIHIEVSSSSSIENDFSQLSRTFYTIDGLENLKKIFWNTFFPAFHIIKNTPGNIDATSVEILIKNFTDELHKLKGHIPSTISDAIKKIILLLSSKFKNHKTIDSQIPIFQQKILASDEKYLIPISYSQEVPTINKTDIVTNEVIFPGEPYREKYTGNLKKACLHDFIPTVKILCWSNEGSRVEKILKSLYKAKFFTDNIKAVFNIPDNYLILSHQTIRAEINEIIVKTFIKDELARISNSKTNLFDFLRAYNHSRYKQTNKEESVKSNIITFTNGDWMYLPKNSKILAVNVKTDGTIAIKKYKFSELSPGMQIVQYQLGRSKLRKMAKNKKELSPIFDNLNIWREALEKLYLRSKKTSKDKYYRLQTQLSITKEQMKNHSSNPSIANLIRWRNDDELLAPAEDNLRLILETNNQSILLKKVVEARRKVRRFDNAIRNQIKEDTLKKLKKFFETETDKESFSINVKGFGIGINLRTILTLEEESFHVSYSDTRKIISG